jgi:hypothetical protein
MSAAVRRDRRVVFAFGFRHGRGVGPDS